VDYTFVAMSRQYLDEMDTWTYGPFFPDFDTRAYRNSADAGAEPLTGPAGCHGYAVLAPDGELVGLFEYHLVEDGSASIGLALKPEMTGRGRGAGVLQAGIEFLLSHYGYRQPYVYLDVALTNEPARKLYERSGFERLGSVAGDHQSVLMRKELPETSQPHR
jgi:ribosomal-protein-alanine N-acetyltransferase